MKFDPAKAIAHRCLFLKGGESSDRRTALASIYKALGIEDGDMNLETTFADTSEPSSWLGAASQYPFLGDRRVVVVRHIGRSDPTKLDPKNKPGKKHATAQAIARLHDFALLILVADTEASEGAVRQAESAFKGWTEIVKAGDGLVIDLTEKVSDYAGFARDQAAAHGKKLSPQAARLLVELVEASPSLIRSEIEKLALFVGDNEEIRLDDIKTTVTPVPEYKVFEMVNAVVGGDAGKALKSMYALAGSSRNLQGDAFPKVFPLLHRQFRLLAQARIVIDAGGSVSNLSPEVVALLPARPNILTENDYGRSRTLQAARRLNDGQIAQCFEILVDTDAKLKGIRPASGTAETLEQMVLSMCQVFRGRASA